MNKKWKPVLISAIITIIVLMVLTPSVYMFIRYEKPETVVLSMRLIDIDESSRDFKLGLTLEVYNPNNLKLKVIRIEGDVFIDDTKVAPVSNLTGTSVPAKGNSEIELVIIVDDSSLRVLTGDVLRIDGRSFGKYLWVKGSSDFEESLDLPGPGSGSNNIPPVAVIEAPLTALVMQDVKFDGSLSRDSDGSIADYSWDLGDGTTADSEIVTHRYTAPGLYIVALKVTDNHGEQDSARHEITVRVRL